MLERKSLLPMAYPTAAFALLSSLHLSIIGHVPLIRARQARLEAQVRVTVMVAVRVRVMVAVDMVVVVVAIARQ